MHSGQQRIEKSRGSKQRSSQDNFITQNLFQLLVNHNSLHDAYEEGGEVVPLSRGEGSHAAEPEEVREKAVNHVKVRATDLWEDGGVAREERENGATQVSGDETTQAVVHRPRALHGLEFK